MKTLKLIMTLLIVTISISCSKDDENTTTNDPTVYQEENPYQSFLTNSGIDLNYTNSPGYYEAGLKFKPIVNGKITKLFIKLPVTKTDLRLTVWDVSSQAVLRTETFESITANVEASKSITPLSLEKNKEYIVSFNSNSWYQRNRTSGNIPYPITVGNIVYTSFQSIPSSSQTYPSDTHQAAIAGDASFAFLRTE
jgi:hypothetical protein